MTDNKPLTYGRQLIEDDDIEAVVEVLRSDFLTSGPKVPEFEKLLTEKTGAAHAISCSSGTAALHLAALALRLGPGDSVVVPSMTFLATANAARYVGAEVVFSDVDPETGIMRASDLERAIETATSLPDTHLKAVFPVHYAGQLADMDAIGTVARDNDLRIVEDACHAIGSVNGDGSPAGSCGHADATVFSFHPVKTITMGEGGAIATNDAELAERASRLRSHGMLHNPDDFSNPAMANDSNGDNNPWYYEMPEVGFNYRASDIQCALGMSQLMKLDRFVERRTRLVEIYDALFDGLDDDIAALLHPTSRYAHSRTSWHLYVVLIDFEAVGMSRGDVMEALQEKGIFTQVHYIPVHRQPYYRQRYGDIDLPNTDAFYQRCLSLPLFPAMDDEDPERVVSALVDILTARR